MSTLEEQWRENIEDFLTKARGNYNDTQSVVFKNEKTYNKHMLTSEGRILIWTTDQESEEIKTVDYYVK